ncbi:MAG: preprotein translocase subunit YajC [Alphaproteobacteria bacterium]
MFSMYLLNAAPAGGGVPQMLMMIIPMFVIFYFLLIRPQQKQQKAFREMISNVGRGDEVLTSGGIKGRVTKAVDENEVELEIAPDVRVRLSRSGIASVLNAKTTTATKETAPAKGKKKNKAKAAENKVVEAKEAVEDKILEVQDAVEDTLTQEEK